MVLIEGGQIDYSSGETVRHDGPISLTGLEYYRLFPGGRDLLLSTAVRMSASFPYVSPAVNLPLPPPPSP
jgi:hypothetical protein